MRTPTWREIEEFCREDGWEFVRSTGHAFFRKTLADGRSAPPASGDDDDAKEAQ